MSGVREVVAKLLLVGQADVDADARWARLEPADREGWLRYADHHLAALRAAGLLVERGEWEYGNQWPSGRIQLNASKTVALREAGFYRHLHGGKARKVFRRRPGVSLPPTSWEEIE
jgi:hypothetical protein